MFFNLVGILKKRLSLQRYPENNLFTLKKNLIPIENLKRGLCEKTPFLICYIMVLPVLNFTYLLVNM